MRRGLSEKICLGTLSFFCITSSLMILKAPMRDLTAVELVRVIKWGLPSTDFWGLVIVPAMASVAIAYIAIGKYKKENKILIARAYLPAMLACAIIAIIGVPIIGGFLVCSLSWVFYNSSKSCSVSS